MRHFMHLNSAPFQAIWDGKKTIELRLFDEKRQLLQLGQQIEFDELGERSRRIVVEIKALHRFASFAELYQALPMEKCGYEQGEQAKPEDMLAYYGKAEQAKYGVVGIEFVVTERKEAVQ